MTLKHFILVIKFLKFCIDTTKLEMAGICGGNDDSHFAYSIGNIGTFEPVWQFDGIFELADEL